MKNYSTSYILTFFLLLFFSKNEAQKMANSQVTLTCQMTGCSKNAPLFLYKFDGYSFNILQKAEPDENKTYTFQVPTSEHEFYFVGTSQRKTKPIILGKEANLTLQGNCSNMRKSEFTNSPINTEYEKAIGQIRGYQSKGNTLNRQYMRAPQGSKKQQNLLKQMKQNDEAQLKLLNDMKAQYPFVGKIVATKTYLSYANNKGNYENEVQYYLTEVFKHIDLKDPDLDRMPAIFETFRDYTTTLVAIKMTRQDIQLALNNILEQMNAEGQGYRFALGAIVQTLRSKNHPAFIDYGNLFIEKYKSENPPYLAEIQKSMNAAKQFLVGAVAPDFEQNTPEGNPMKLSDLRGKVVLVDFWASWCRPCRNENPNVVRLYNKYKEKGFDVIGISLDKTKDRWLKAIEKDGLEWHHVSDLRGWSNTVAKQYSVSSIPHTILLDRDGKIIANKLRGPQLEQTLKEIFGE